MRHRHSAVSERRSGIRCIRTASCHCFTLPGFLSVVVQKHGSWAHSLIFPRTVSAMRGGSVTSGSEPSLKAHLLEHLNPLVRCSDMCVKRVLIQWMKKTRSYIMQDLPREINAGMMPFNIYAHVAWSWGAWPVENFEFRVLETNLIKCLFSMCFWGSYWSVVPLITLVLPCTWGFCFPDSFKPSLSS